MILYAFGDLLVGARAKHELWRFAHRVNFTLTFG
jgi:hypothetical protein